MSQDDVLFGYRLQLFDLAGRSSVSHACRVFGVHRDDETVYVNRTKDEIEQAPEFDEDNYRGADYRSTVGGYYGSRKAASDRETAEEQVSDRK